jgi:Spy/CpxP family protein refolding chaperone
MDEPVTGPEGPQSPIPQKKRGWLRGVLLGAAFAATFAAGGLLMSGPSAIAMQAAMDHMGMGGEGHMGAMHAQLHAHIAKMLDAADATPEQKAKIHKILMDAMEQLKPLHAKFAGAHKDLHAIFTAPVIDRAALEQLRAARIADVDEGSKVLVQALADAADVLTPEQRAKMGAAMARHHEGHPHPHG